MIESEAAQRAFGIAIRGVDAGERSERLWRFALRG